MDDEYALKKEEILDFINFRNIKSLNPDIKWFVQETIGKWKKGIDKCIQNFEENIPKVSLYSMMKK